MLVISRKSNETLMLGDKIEIRVLGAKSDSVRLGIVAPREVSVVRGELLEKVREQNLAALHLDPSKLQEMAAKVPADKVLNHDSDVPKVEIPDFSSLQAHTSWLVHDVRNFLTPVHGELQLSLLDCPEGEVRESIETAHTHIKDLKTWLQNTSALGRTATFSQDEIPVLDAFRQTAATWKGAAALELDCCPDVKIRNTQPELPKILHMLAKNSEEAQATIISVSARNTKRGLELKIKDNGTGIDRSTLENLGKPLYSTKRNHKGRGLYLTRIWTHGFSGRMFVKSKLGWGVETTLLLSHPPKRFARKPSQVLLKDQFLSKSHLRLRELGFSVLTAQSDREFLILKKRYPEVVIFDPKKELLQEWLDKKES